jgi:Holliday junction resolvase RusA-like endonuclease
LAFSAAESAALAIDRPFAPPLECVIDLPFPPSVNRIWRNTSGARGHVYLSAEYRAWIKQANMAVIVNGTWRKRTPMPGEFRALILLSRAERAGDVDNRIKAVLDWAQRSELIRDDRLCEEITARWAATTEAPHGCRLILRSVTP